MRQVFMRKKLLRPATVGPEQVPVPRCAATGVLIGNRCSLISAGTESSSVKRNVKDMVVKAMTNPALRQSVFDMLVKDGLTRTYDRVNYETTKWTPLGYSGAGVALEVGREVEGIRPGDLVAYGGEGHAEIIHAPRNLCVRVPDGVTANDASFVALGSIALQAVRRAAVEVGDRVAVIGLGLVGQLVSQLVRTAGGRVVAIDVNAGRLELARSLGAELTLTAGPGVPDLVREATAGRGVDRVLMCASTASNEVIEQAIDMVRDRGRIVMVGFVGMDIPQEAFYRKELELLVSRSYGPGRYDPAYEQKGQDYPFAYVRWTEQRNMDEFLKLLQDGRVRVGPLVTHEFTLPQSEEAYRTLVESPGGCMGILLKYDEQQDPTLRTVQVASTRTQPRVTGRPIGMAVAGCGGFARQFHLPNLKASPNVSLRALVASTGQSAQEMATRYGAAISSTDYDAVLRDDQVDAVCIFTRDAAHARMSLAALNAGKHVFCEKPLAITVEECEQLAAQITGDRICMVGFNRRFAPLVRDLQNCLKQLPGPRMMIYRVNAGPLPRDNWVFDPSSAAGRIVGEVCHFVDLLTWLTGAEPVSVTATALGASSSINEMEDVSAQITFADGSIGTVIYACRGTTASGKERLEIFTGSTSLVMDDFRSLTVTGAKPLEKTDRQGDKGHGAELQHFLQCVRGEARPELTHIDGIRATLVCLAIWESARAGGEPVQIPQLEVASEKRGQVH
ncbi:MAG: bi-domain-containing oxidoreductase [Planctomycetaceae bacterium]|jgi:polar amino acid transport system substrate-binding protein